MNHGFADLIQAYVLVDAQRKLRILQRAERSAFGLLHRINKPVVDMSITIDR